MPSFLEYVTRSGAGRFTVEGTSLTEAVAGAGRAVEGLGCLRAALRYTLGTGGGFGEGALVAAYSPAEGWEFTQAREE